MEGVGQPPERSTAGYGRSAMKSAKDWAKLISAGVLVVLALAVFEFAHFSLTFQIPQGYRGWVEIRFEEPKCPPLSRRGFSLLIPISPTGQGCTSGHSPLGEWRRWHFVFVKPDGAQIGGELNGLILDHSGGNSDDGKRLWFYVGTEEEYRKDIQKMPRNP